MIAWAVDALIAITFLLLLVLTIRRPVAHLFGAEWAYALWLLPFLRLILPPLPSYQGEISSVLPQATAFIPAVGEVVAPLSLNSAFGGGASALLALWVGGAAIFAIWQQSTYSAFRLSLGSDPKPGKPPVYGGIDVVESDAVDGPAAVGLLHRHIVVPTDFDTRYGVVERRLALEHELIHHRRGDIWWNMAALLVLALNWFNPVAWIAFRAFRADQELSCDALVAAQATQAERHDYACAMVKSATRDGLVAGCALNNVGQLKRRLKMMRSHRRSAMRRAGGLLVTGCAVLGGLGLTATVSAKEVASTVRVAAADQVASVIEAVAAPAPLPRQQSATPSAISDARPVTPTARWKQRRSQGNAVRKDRPVVTPDDDAGVQLQELAINRANCQPMKSATPTGGESTIIICRQGAAPSSAEAEAMIKRFSSDDARKVLERARAEGQVTAFRRRFPALALAPHAPGAPSGAPIASTRRMFIFERGALNGELARTPAQTLEALERSIEAIEQQRRQEASKPEREAE